MKAIVMNFLGAAALTMVSACGSSGGGDAAAPSPVPTALPTTAPSPTPAPGADTSTNSRKAASASLLAMAMAQKTGASFVGTGTKARKQNPFCNGGGDLSTNNGVRNVGSPFTTDDFDVTDVAFDNCTLLENAGSTSTRTNLDGVAAGGAPVSDPSAIIFGGFGDQNGDLFANVVFSDGSGDSADTDLSFNGVLHVFVSETGLVEIQQNLDIDAQSTATFEGVSDSVSFTSRFGAPGVPFRFTIQENGAFLNLTVDGDLNYASPQLPEECPGGLTTFNTLQPLQIDGEQITGGLMEITNSGVTARVQYNSDGSTDILVDGQSIMFSPEELQSINAACSLSGTLLGTSLEFSGGFVEGFSGG